MKWFTYGKYIRYIHTLRLNAVLQLAEENEEYKLERKDKSNLPKSLIKEILQDKKEIEKFINDFLKPKKAINEKEIKEYKNQYITKKYKIPEKDIIYKIKNDETFFLIEYQDGNDKSMTYRMLNCSIDIMQEWCKNRKVNKNTKYPIIAPIVIYTGNKKWQIPKNFSECQIKTYEYERYKINSEYNIIDINKISKQTLLNQQTKLGYAMLIEKSKNKQELINNLEIAIETAKKEENIKKLYYIIRQLKDEEIKQNILKKIEKII